MNCAWPPLQRFGFIFDLEPPRDRDGTFEPPIIQKSQSHLTQMDKSESVALCHRHEYAKYYSDLKRTLKQRYTKSESTTKGPSYREISIKGVVLGHHGCIKEMDDADTELATRIE